MTIDRNQLPSLYDPSFREVFNGGFQEAPAIVSSLFMPKDITTKTHKIGTVIPIGGWETATELQDLVTDAPMDGYTKTFTPVKYRKGVNISFEAVDDDERGEVTNISSQLLSFGRGAGNLVERECAKVLNQGFTTTTTPDSQYLFSDNHPLKTKGIRTSTAGDNKYTGVLSHDNLETFEKQIRTNAVDDRGEPVMEVLPTVLLVPPALRATAERICSARAVERPNTGNRDINVWSGSYQVVTSPHLSTAWGGSDTAWFLVKPQFGLWLVWRARPTYSSWTNYSNESYWFGGSMRLTVGAADWRGVWGSTGTTAS